MPVSAGTRLGPYEILSSIGAGGMGEVYKARDTRLERTVAIKILPTHLSSNTQARERFDREAKAVSNLSHLHICPLYDVSRTARIRADSSTAERAPEHFTNWQEWPPRTGLIATRAEK